MRGVEGGGERVIIDDDATLTLDIKFYIQIKSERFNRH